MNPPAVLLKETVDVRLLANLSHNFRSPYEAIFELVDNALASQIAGSPVLLTIKGDSSVGGSMTFTAKGGSGMGAEDLGLFLRWGKKPDEIGLNCYGQGGKAAIGYLGRGLYIRANAQGQEVAYEFEDRDWLSRPDGEAKEFMAPAVPAPLPGVGLVEIRVTDLQRDINYKKLHRELAWRYRPALEANALELKIKRQRVAPPPLPAENRIHIAETLVVPAATDSAEQEPVQLSGWIGIAPPKWDGRGGIRCSAFGRVVNPNAYFGHRDASFKASLNSLVGELDLSFVPVQLNKNDFDEASPQWEAVQEVAHRAMAPLVEKLLERKETLEPSEEERERAMEARDLAHQAMRHLAEQVRQGEAGFRTGRKPPEPRPDGEPASKPTDNEESDTREPATPPPDGAVGKLSRRGSVSDWDVRALDPKIRSAAVEEQGRTEIVINCAYPLYQERRGDYPYLIETGLMEELKPRESNDKTVAEYHEEVVAILYESLSRLGKRKRRR